MPEVIPDECQLCRPLDYRGDDIQPPDVTVEIMREDGGTKFIYCCKRCMDELWEVSLDDPTVAKLPNWADRQ